MSAIAIRAEHLSKRYFLGEGARVHDSLREHVTDGVRRLFRGRPRAQTDALWALRDISLDIAEGQVVGVIGRNGAGKSTLLKVLTRITEPTSGRAEIYGRVGSLLEVGTGFHPDLTGRENIFLNGAILGLTKAEIRRRFDEIVEFSEIGRFLDTPVKRYSSGMYVRLAFAVAAHLEAEILLVDEVLAVGDEAFRQKCLGKMGSVVAEGRTVLFVSHSMAAISTVCPTTIWLRDGQVAAHGETRQVVADYLAATGSEGAEAAWSFADAPRTPVARLRSVTVLNDRNETAFDVWMNESTTVRVEFWMLEQSRTDVILKVHDQVGVLVFSTGHFHDETWSQSTHEPGLYACSWRIPAQLLNEGHYHVTVGLRKNETVAVEVSEAVSFNVVDPGDTRGRWTDTWPGVVRPIVPWTGGRVGDLPSEDRDG